MADDACRSLQAGHIIPSVNPRTVADGLLTSLGDLTFPIIQRRVEQIATVSEAGILTAMRFVWERAKLIIEPSAAVAVGVLMEHKIDLVGLRVGVILSGGNVDLDRLPWQSRYLDVASIRRDGLASSAGCSAPAQMGLTEGWAPIKSGGPPERAVREIRMLRLPWCHPLTLPVIPMRCRTCRDCPGEDAFRILTFLTAH